jgi:hypothetical protein
MRQPRTLDAESTRTILVVIAAGPRAPAWRSPKSAVDRAANLQVEELVAERTKSARLKRDLEQVRGTERQEFRFTSYGLLWATMPARDLSRFPD